ncbi:uncharacterized protein [Solanum lycopersicum]|uniref:uncharacterized protein n=1 Tax=Solanum lycopersicum TaxID=4081 RepID=UPI003749E76E
MAYSRKKSYADHWRRDLEFEEVLQRFGKVEYKLKVLQRVDKVDYKLKLPSELALVHPVFHVSMLKKCIVDPESILPIEGIGVKDNLSYSEFPVQILYRQVKKLRTKEVISVKVQVPPLEEDANVDQAPVNPPTLTDGDIRAAIIQLAQDTTVQAQSMTAQANREFVTHPHQQVTTMASRLRGFTRMNPLTFYESKVDEDSQELINEVSKILLAMEFSSSEKAELATYQLKDMEQAWYVQWRDNRPLRSGSVTWEIFKAAFLDLFFPMEMREEKVGEFINIHQGGRSVHEYSLEFIKFSKYAPSLVFYPRNQMSHYVTGVSEDLQEESHSSMLHDNMNIFHLMVH